MKGQVSTELLVIVGLVLLIFIPLLVLVYFKASEANQQIASYQAELAVFRVAYLASSVGSLGTNTSVNTDVYMPNDMLYLKTGSTAQGGEIVMAVDTPQGATEIVEIVRYPIRNPGTVVESSAAGSWVRLKITSEYVGGQAYLRVERTT